MTKVRCGLLLVAVFAIVVVVGISSSRETSSVAFAQSDTGSLVNPDSSDAFVLQTITAIQSVKSIYDVFCSTREFVSGGSCETHRQSYISSLVSDIIYENIALIIWDKTMGEIFTAENSNMTPPYETEKIIAMDPELMEFNQAVAMQGRHTGGLGYMVASTYAMMHNDPPVPTDLALFFRDSVGDTIFGTPAYAANPIESTYQEVVLGAWRITRNTALALLGAVLGVAGLMIIFRSKLSPQVTVSIYNVLPTLPISIVLIVLSYPIVSLVLANISTAMGIASQMGASILTQVIGIDLTPETTMYGGVLETLNVPFRIFQAVGGIGPGTLAMAAFMGLGILIAMGFVLWEMAKVFVSFVIVTIISPLILLLSVLPGKQGLMMNLGKRVLVDFISLPVIILTFYIAMAVILYMPFQDPAGWPDALSRMVAVSATPAIILVKLFIGFGLLFSVRKIRTGLEQAVGVQSLWGIEPPKRP